MSKFNTSKNFKLSTYTTYWIRQKTSRSVQNTGRTIRTPIHIHAKLTEIQKVFRSLLKLLKRPPTPEELASYCNLPVEKVKELGRNLYPVMSLDHSVNEDDQTSPIQSLSADVRYEPDWNIEDRIDREYVEGLISQLSKSDQDFILYRFGFLDGREKTLAETMEYSKFSKKEVKKTEERIIQSLKELAEAEKLNVDFDVDLILTGLGDKPLKVIEFLKSFLSSEKLSKLVQDPELPLMVLNKIRSSKAQEIQKELTKLNAETKIKYYDSTKSRR